MKSITIKLKGDKYVQMLTELLKSISFVDSVEVQEDEDKLSEEEITLVEERWAEYKKNPKSTIPWNAVKSKIRKKHGI
jgi:putative addiction module component (TIGR02574 family)